MLGRPRLPLFLQSCVIFSFQAVSPDEEDGRKEGDTAAWDHDIIYVPDTMGFSTMVSFDFYAGPGCVVLRKAGCYILYASMATDVCAEDRPNVPAAICVGSEITLLMISGGSIDASSFLIYSMVVSKLQTGLNKLYT